MKQTTTIINWRKTPRPTDLHSLVVGRAYITMEEALITPTISYAVWDGMEWIEPEMGYRLAYVTHYAFDRDVKTGEMESLD